MVGVDDPVCSELRAMSLSNTPGVYVFFETSIGLSLVEVSDMISPLFTLMDPPPSITVCHLVPLRVDPAKLS